jgi:hypothetical protein
MAAFCSDSTKKTIPTAKIAHPVPPSWDGLRGGGGGGNSSGTEKSSQENQLFKRTAVFPLIRPSATFSQLNLGEGRDEGEVIESTIRRLPFRFWIG